MPTEDKEPKPYKPPTYAQKFAKSVLKGNSADMRAFIEALMFEEDNPEVVKVRLQQFLETTEEYLAGL